MIRTVLVCQGRTCSSSGSKDVLQAFQECPISSTDVQSCQCLGQCGSGPMVLIVPEQIWYCEVQAQQVPAIVKQHLAGGKPVSALLYRKFHPLPPNPPLPKLWRVGGWVAACLLLGGMVLFAYWLFHWHPSPYLNPG